MRLRELLPFQQTPTRGKKAAQVIDAPTQKAVGKLMKVASLALGFQSGIPIGYRTIFEYAPYDFTRIIQANDTDSYVKQAFMRYRELIWKEGWEPSSDNYEALAYLKQRILFMEIAMKRPFTEFLMECTDQLVKFHNLFLVKSRGDLGEFFPEGLDGVTGKQPIVGYYIIPSETMQILRDRNNNVLQYRQNIWGANAISGAAYGNPSVVNAFPTFEVPDVIHMMIDRKPGRAFGTPFLTAVMDDVLALRQIEEDLQNLIHRELFPLFKYIVGTETRPAQPGEVEAAADDLAHLRSEGGLVLPDRHDVDVIGSEGKALEISNYLDHFKERVAVGLGLSQHHLGMTANGGNRAVTDRLDVMLYDKIKTYQKTFAAMVELFIFNELLLEGGYDPHVNLSEGISDRCQFVFNEIDVDTQIKKENHIIQKWTADTMMMPEVRQKLKEKPLPEDGEHELYSSYSARMLPSPGQPIKPGEGGGGTGNNAGKASPSLNGQQPLKPNVKTNNPGGGKAGIGKTATPKGPAGQKNPALGNPGLDKPRTLNRNVNKARKQAGNRGAPQNQYTRRLSPNVRHADDEVAPTVEFNKWLEECVYLIDQDELQ